MHRVWLVLLAACGFHNELAPDATVNPPPPDGQSIAAAGCVRVTAPSASITACPIALADSLAITGTPSIDTSPSATNDPIYSCAQLTSDSAQLCVLAARTITLDAAAVLSAHGSRPLALVGHSIDIEGTIDVASHVGGPQGPAANSDSCESAAPADRPTGNGGGAGGTFGADQGAQGGAGNGTTTGDKGGGNISSTGITELSGGCAGGATNPDETGGSGGGAIWLAVDDTGTITLGASATINASGAGGAGGSSTATTHGGSGGGSGGMIILLADNLDITTGAQIFANGGGGGGGANNNNPGSPGSDPKTAMMQADGGKPADMPSSSHPGSGGSGYTVSQSPHDGSDASGDPSNNSGGGGGGGGAGTIWLAVQHQTGKAATSPTPTDLLHPPP